LKNIIQFSFFNINKIVAHFYRFYFDVARDYSSHLYIFIGFDGCVLNKYFVGTIKLIDIL